MGATRPFQWAGTARPWGVLSTSCTLLPQLLPLFFLRCVHSQPMLWPMLWPAER